MRLLLILLLLTNWLFSKEAERYYQKKFAKEIGGQVEVVMKDGTRCDILTDTHAIEVDFAIKWAESIGQSLNHAMHTGKKAGILLILDSDSDEKHLERLEAIIESQKLDIEVFLMLTDEASEKLADTTGEHVVKLLAIGDIDKIILRDDGKKPKMYHEFKNLKVGWEKEIPFTDSFTCYSSSLENVRFYVDDGYGKMINGEGVGNFSWGNPSE